MNQKLLIFSIRSMSLAIICLLFYTPFLMAQSKPLAIRGVLDLRQWDFQQDEVVNLDGEWQFYWNQLLLPEDLETKQGRLSGYFKVPKSWNNYELEDGTKVTAEGYGTFYLKILLPDKKPLLIFKIPDLGTAYELWINRQLSASAGEIGTTREHSRPQLLPHLVQIQTDQSSLELVLRMSNYHAQAGGPWYSISLGSDLQQQILHKQAIAIDLFLVGSLLIMGLYHLGLFFLRPKDRSALYFGIFCLFFALRTLVVGERLFQMAFPWIDWEVGRKIEYISFYMGAPILSLFTYELFPEEFNHRIHRAFLVLAVPFILCVILTPSYIYTYTLTYFQIFSIIWILYNFIAVTKAVIHHREDSMVFIAGWIIITLGLTNDILSSMEMIQTPPVFAFALFLFIFVQAFLLSIRFSKAFFLSESLLVENQGLVLDLRRINEHLEDMVNERTEQLRIKTNDIQSMLENLPEGILMITDDFDVHPEYSKYLETVLETTEIAHANIRELLFKNSNLGDDAIHCIETAIIACLLEDKRNFQMNAHLFIHEMDKNFDGERTKHLELTWAPIVNEDEQIDKVLLGIRDVTTLRSLQRQADQHQLELELIGQILAVSPEEFQRFITSCFGFLDENERLIQRHEEKSPELLELLFRNMHTIKGNARTYGFQHITHQVHHAEQEYDELRRNQALSWNTESLLMDIQKIRSLVQDYARLNEEKLRRKPGESLDGMNVTESEIAKAVEVLETVEFSELQKVKDVFVFLRSFMHKLTSRKLEQILHGVIHSLDSLSKELGKSMPLVVIEDQGISFRKNTFSLLQNVFMHLLRNSLDHGIETPEEREAQGKSKAGTIQIELVIQNDQLRITCQDDGRGLALEKIHQKAVENKVVSTTDVMEPQSIADLVFLSGLSTQETVSEISGRGVGMDAVK
ncbi:MAG: Hpt domain-containing protein, partial [SAR324 cluster bacterium]|nr:Hpt domain-containing protein [SAR324 cluster bacterium]